MSICSAAIPSSMIFLSPTKMNLTCSAAWARAMAPNVSVLEGWISTTLFSGRVLAWRRRSSKFPIMGVVISVFKWLFLMT